MDESKIQTPIPANGHLATHLARFGVFELCLDTGELRKYGFGIRLQRRSFCVLQALLEKHGEVVTREELRTRLWGDGTFVDFESGMNTAVNRLRSALGDSADKPVYIETLARLGYRFVAPVTFLPAPHQNAKVELGPPGEPPAKPKNETRRRWWIGAFCAIAAAVTLALLAGQAGQRHAEVSYRQLTISPGFVQNARFLHDGRRVAYSSIAHGNASRTFVADADGRDAANPKPLGLTFEASEIAGVSPLDELALLSPGKNDYGMAVQLVRQDGSQARQILEKGFSVDWAKDGRLARIVFKDGWRSVEFPMGHELYRSHAWLDTVRVSPRGDRVAFIEHPIERDDAGQVMIAGPAERARVLSAGWESVEGLAWHPSGNEVWFTAATAGVDRKLRAVSLRGRLRQVAEIPGGMILRDINPAGDVLILRPTLHMSMLRGSLPGKALRDISLLDWSSAVAIAADGKSILFYESGEGGGRNYSVYLYNADKDASERIASGRALDLSADGQWALTQKSDDATNVSLISLKDHKATVVNTNGAAYNWARFLGGRDCREIVAGVSDPGQSERLIEQELPDGKPIAVMSDLYLSDAIVDEAGRIVVGLGAKPGLAIADLDSKTVRYVEPVQKVHPVAFAKDGRLITSRRDHNSIILETLNLATGIVTPYSEVRANDTAGISVVIGMFLAHDRQTFVYSAAEKASTLYLVSGWS